MHHFNGGGFGLVFALLFLVIIVAVAVNSSGNKS